MIDRQQTLVTVLGGGGFIGRYVCEALLRAGVRVRVAQRDPRQAHFIQPLAAVGQVSFLAADLARPATIARAVQGAEAVVNLVGILKGRLVAVHVDGARTLAECARDAGSTAFVQVSAIGADAGSRSAYGRSKAEGEAAVRAILPFATVIRPSLVFGPEDQITNRFARMAGLPILPVIAPQTRFQPIYVRDLARAVSAAALQPLEHAARTYELGGPEMMTMRTLNERVAALAGQSPNLVEVPDLAARLVAKLGFLPGAPLTEDQWLMLQRDNVPTAGSSGLEAFGITPTPLASVAGEWLDRYRRGGRFAQTRRTGQAPA